MQEHLRPVTTTGDQPPTQAKRRAPQRQRPNKPLPSDRMKFDSALLALKAIVLDSANGTKPVGAEEMSKRLALSAATAGLNNAFFVEAGLVTRESKGRWKPTAAATHFARMHSFDRDRAGESLTDPLRASWYFKEVEQQLAMGPTTVPQMIEVLAHAAGATAEHRPQLRLILDWLAYAGLIDTDQDKVTLVGTVPQTDEPPTSSAEEPRQGETAADPASAPREKPTTHATTQQPSAGTVLRLNFDFSLTAADLAALTADQIRAVFEAVGQVAAIKATIDS